METKETARVKILGYRNGVNVIRCFECNDKPIKRKNKNHTQPCCCHKCHDIQCLICCDTRILFAIRCYECKREKQVDYGYRDDGHGQWCANWQDCKTCEGKGFILVPSDYKPRLNNA